jgi:hypothetical protein
MMKTGNVQSNRKRRFGSAVNAGERSVSFPSSFNPEKLSIESKEE